MIRTHENLLVTAQSLAHSLHLSYTDRVVAYQSLSQPFDVMLGIFVTVIAGTTVALIEHHSDAFSAARQFEATVFNGGGTVLRRLHDALTSARSADGYVRDATCALVGRYCRLVVSTDVVTTQLHTVLASAGVALCTVFGSPLQTTICQNGPRDFVDGAIGIAFETVQLRVGENSELEVARSPFTAVGIHRHPDDFSTQFSGDGRWMRTGHCIERSASGSFRITGEMQELLALAEGRLLAPHAIEAALTALPLVAHAMCHADGTASLVAVLSLDRQRVEQFALARGVVAPWEALVMHPQVYDELARGVERINAEHDAAERVTAFTPTDLEFSVHTGELDDVGAIVRPTVTQRFRHILAELHQGRVS